MLKILLCAYAFLLPYEYLFWFLFRSLTILKPYRLCGLVIVIVWLLQRINSRSNSILKLDSIDKRFLLLLVWGIILAFTWMAIASSDLSDTRRHLVLISYSLGLYLVLKNSALTAVEVSRLLMCFVWGCLSSIFVALNFMGWHWSGRFGAMFNDNIAFGLFAGMAALVLICRVVLSWPRNPMVQCLHVLCIAILTFFLLLSGSRSALFSFLLSVALTPFLLTLTGVHSRLLRKRALAFFLLPILLAGAFSGARQYSSRSGSNVFVRYSSDHLTKSIRYILWKNALNFCMHTYFLGAGLGQYRQHFFDVPGYDNLDFGEYRSPRIALGTHNDCVEVLANYGAPGLILFLSILYSIFVKTRRTLSTISGKRKTALSIAPIYALLPIFVSYLTCGMFIVLLFNPVVMFFVALMTVDYRPRTHAPRSLGRQANTTTPRPSSHAEKYRTP